MPAPLTTKAFIKKCKAKFPDAPYDYSKVKYINTKTHVTIICTLHNNKMIVVPDTFLRTKGCDECSGRKIYNTASWIEEAERKNGKRYDYSKAKYRTADLKIKIICRIHGSYEIRPRAHLAGDQCRKCSTFQYNTKKWVKAVSVIHNNKYIYTKSKINGNSPVKIHCQEHNLIFKICPNEHMGGKACPKCNPDDAPVSDSESNSNTDSDDSDPDIRRRGLPTLDKKTKEFVKKCQKVYPNLDFSKVVYTKRTAKVIIICPIHGKYKTIAKNLLKNGGQCQECIRTKGYTEEEFIEKCKEVHGNKYTYENIDYESMHKQINVTCAIHGQITVKASNFVRGSGCIKCAGCYQYTTEEYIGEANKKHNNKYTYEKTKYKHSKDHVVVTCSEHGKFEIGAAFHLIGQGCQKCARVNYSRKSIDWLEEIMKTSPDIKIQHAENGGEYTIPGTRWRADGYDAKSEIIYEFHGDYFHGNPAVYGGKLRKDINWHYKKPFGELYKDTKQREKLLRRKGYTLRVIWERDWQLYLDKKSDILYTTMIPITGEEESSSESDDDDNDNDTSDDDNNDEEVNDDDDDTSDDGGVLSNTVDDYRGEFMSFKEYQEMKAMQATKL